MPGISATNEASAGLYIRGGTPDQNLVLFDGFTIYDVDHFFGIFSAFNANAIEDITMYKGGFESKYGSISCPVFVGKVTTMVSLASISTVLERTNILGGQGRVKGIG